MQGRAGSFEREDIAGMDEMVGDMLRPFVGALFRPPGEDRGANEGTIFGGGLGPLFFGTFGDELRRQHPHGFEPPPSQERYQGNASNNEENLNRHRVPPHLARKGGTSESARREANSESV